MFKSYPSKRKVSTIGKATIIYILIGIGVFWSILPILWLFGTAFKSPAEFQGYPPTLFPKNPTLQHIIATWKDFHAIFYVRNSLIVCSLATLFSLIVGSLAAYTLVRLKPKGGTGLNIFILTLIILPPATMIIPYYVIFSGIRLTDNLLSLILVYQVLCVPYAVWMIKGFLQSTLIELEDAARIDGCSRLGAFFRITIPLMTQGLVATGIFIFLLCWNEFLFALILTESLRAQTIPILAMSATFAEAGSLWGQIGTTGIHGF